ncbi:MAG: glycosyltransferase family 2 protein [Longimicrobiales bacterium]|nr:glycosyltransferase family 2 protein [Longimicrobiales bacterium]
MDPTDPLLILAAVTLLVVVLLSVDLLVGLRSLPRLSDADRSGRAPTVSVVLAARDEADHIAQAVQSLLDQDHPALEIVAVDDRSTDGTGQILDRLAEAHARVRVLHVRTLPDGWLGKNHALQRGAEAATGELLLFTDADVMMAPGAVSRAVGVLERDGLDHLAVAPRIRAGTAAATMTVAVFLALFSAVFRPWKARDPESRFHIGIGAFNLIRAEAYHSIGGHRTVALRPDDDVRLGRALKEEGFRQATAIGIGLTEVEWYPTLRAMARGLRKNAFAVVEYRLSLVAAGTAIPFLFIFWPVAALLVTTGAVWWLNAAIVVGGAVVIFDTARAHGLPAWTALTYPLASAILLWIVWAAALRALRKGTIEWRGTEYPLSRLRQEA